MPAPPPTRCPICPHFFSLMPLLPYIVALFATFLVSLVSTLFIMPRLLRLCKHRGLYDMPNERKVHQNKIPRLGGVLFAPCMAVGMGVGYLLLLRFFPTGHLPMFRLSTMMLIVGMFMIYLIGIFDDLLGLKASFKFSVQLVSTLLMPLCGLYVDNLYGFCGLHEIPLWAGYPLTVFLCLLIVNSINLIDGIDGLSSGLSMIALTVFAVVFSCLGVVSYTLLAVGLVGTVLGFSYFNLFGQAERDTKTFMGDTGSLVLGYAIAYLAIKHAMNNGAIFPYRPYALLLSFTLLIVPCFDLIRVALGRLLRGEGIFHPDKTHLHHRCMAAGFTMHRSLMLILALQVGFIVFNLLAYRYLQCSTTLIVVADVAFFTLFVVWLEHRRNKRSSKQLATR